MHATIDRKFHISAPILLSDGNNAQWKQCYEIFDPLWLSGGACLSGSTGMSYRTTGCNLIRPQETKLQNKPIMWKRTIFENLHNLAYYPTLVILNRPFLTCLVSRWSDALSKTRGQPLLPFYLNDFGYW